ncbi:hypothetical protein SSYRP_v1c05020 [Spiroplasma syrphidicola EA-1]|uniref:Transmembrane protein n=1 Tax=Spiroplasma syrphidicola EA-1 TaxID=1276229 RepID=R4UDX2_9MOLU|nr:hypothetical protein [Spiroplasma syrphidicola]AGM26094.1 hypothetical protein SSYRP_v1c05020 [Spiroplasma syrphidicola EA-1]
MEMHIILIFTLVLAICLYGFHIIFLLHYQNQKKIINFKKEYKWKGMIIFVFTGIYGILTPIILFVAIDYFLLLFVPNISPIWAYLYVIIGLINYALILIYLIIETLTINSLWIKVTEAEIIFLDETVNFQQVIGLDITGFFKKFCFMIEGDKEKKTIIGKKAFNFLKDIEN